MSTDPNIQLPALPAASALQDTDLFHIRQGNTDKKGTLLDIKNALDADDVGAVPTTRQINTTAPITGGGALSSNLTLDITDATTSARGAVVLADNTETQEGIVNNRAVTPASLASRTATETRSGLVIKATDQEVVDGVEDTKYLTSQQLQAKIDSQPSANTTSAGRIRIGTVGEQTQQTSNSVAVTPFGLQYAFQGVKANDGYMRLPNGWIVQWMRGPTGTTDNTLRTKNWPIPFPNAALHVSTSFQGFVDSGVLVNGNVWIRSWDNNSVTIAYDGVNVVTTVTPLVFAIGH